MSELVDTLRQLLGSRSEPISAIDIAAALGIYKGKHDSKRRRVRELVNIIRATNKDSNGRDADNRVCADAVGYWMARSDTEWQEYKDCVKRRSCFRFVRLRNWTNAAIDIGNKQGELFENPKGNNLAWT